MKASGKTIVGALGMLGAVSLVLSGCMESPSRPEAEKEAQAPSLPGDQDPAWLREKALEWTDPVTGERYIKDPESGEKYLLNPGRKRMGAEPAEGALAKAAGLTNAQVDWSGQVETAWWECSDGVKRAHNLGLTCQVDPGYVLVGGGAYADYGTGAGAFLTESRPLDGNLVTWSATSKDHSRSSPHVLRVYAIGLRLKDIYYNIMPSTTLRSYMTYGTNSNTTPASYPSTYVTMDWQAHREIIGGGVKVNWATAGNLLVRSIPGTSCYPDITLDNPGKYCLDLGRGKSMWNVQGRDLSRVEKTTITASAIRIHSYMDIPNFGNIQIQILEATITAPEYSNTPAKISATPGWVMTCPGGDANPEMLAVPPERLLVGIRPEFLSAGQAMAAAYSKDHVVARAGKVRVTVSQIRKRP